jgi:hypothetical protein
MREKNRGLSLQLKDATTAPVLHCCTTQSFWDNGMSNVLISREIRRQQIAYAMILIDRFCLGAKNAFGALVSRAEYNVAYRKMAESSPLVALPATDLRALVEDAIEFARGIGFEPHPDYHRVKSIFGDIDASAATERFEFGDKDGKPHFIAGPNDSALHCQEIMRRLEHHCGSGGYLYTIPFDGLAPGGEDDLDSLYLDHEADA